MIYPKRTKKPSNAVTKSQKGLARVFNLEQELPSERLWQIFNYEHETGKLFWKTREELANEGREVSNYRKRFCGKEALTSRGSNGYYRGIVEGWQVYRHEVIWAMMEGYWSEHQLEFVNRNVADTRIENLQIRVRRTRSVLDEADFRLDRGDRRKLSTEFVRIYMELNDDGEVVWRLPGADIDGEHHAAIKGDPVFTGGVANELEVVLICGRKLLKVQAVWALHYGEFIDGGFRFRDNDPTNVDPDNVEIMRA